MIEVSGDCWADDVAAVGLEVERALVWYDTRQGWTYLLDVSSSRAPIVGEIDAAADTALADLLVAIGDAVGLVLPSGELWRARPRGGWRFDR